MKKLIVPSAILAAGIAFLVGCGDENTTEITQVVGMQVLDKGEALPKCTADNEGAMVYSVDSAEAYYCVNKKWKSMEGNGGDDKNGTDGKDGAAGADGKDGKDGKNGKDGSSCTAQALKNGKGYKIVCGGDSVGVVLNGEDGLVGAKGDSGVAGLSAYEIAKAAGYTGNEEDWIASLKGDPGDPGDPGTSCTAEEISDGVKITCTDGKTYTLSNGADGKDGKSLVGSWMVDSRDWQLYRVVTIGEQTWMAQNLNYETEVGSYCYNDSAVYCQKYGRLYTWATAVGKSEEECGIRKNCNLDTGYVRGVCPDGWHLPDTTEWKALFDAVGGIETAGTMLKSTEGWKNNGNGSDPYSFSALPAGFRDGNGDFNYEGDNVHFWSSPEYGSYGAEVIYLGYGPADAFLGYNNKYYGYSVRCLRD